MSRILKILLVEDILQAAEPKVNRLERGFTKCSQTSKMRGFYLQIVHGPFMNRQC